MNNPVYDDCAVGKGNSSHFITAYSKFREVAHVMVAVAGAAMVCFPLLLAARPKTPLRVFCIGAFEFLARLRGGTLGKQRRLAIAHACDFGSLCDDYHDHRRLDASEYRALRRDLRRMAPEPATCRYIRRLRKAERNRPILLASDPNVPNAVVAYRTSVLDVSLRWMQEISGLSPEAAKFQVLLDLVSLMQIADDVLDWKEDQASQSPSYVTALLLSGTSAGVAKSLRAEADALLGRVVHWVRRDLGAMPFAATGAVTWTLVVALLKARFHS